MCAQWWKKGFFGWIPEKTTGEILILWGGVQEKVPLKKENFSPEKCCIKAPRLLPPVLESLKDGNFLVEKFNGISPGKGGFQNFLFLFVFF